jgi:hypothetical protein
MEIERNPIPPKLTKKAIQLITELCFRQDNELKKVDGIFVYASTVNIEKLVELLEDVLSKDISNKIFITGGTTPKHLAKELGIKPKLKEADLLLKAFDLDRYEDLKVFVERESTNTLENVTETLKYKEFKNCKSLLFIFKSHPAGRGYLTLRKFFPKAEILQKTFNAKYDKAEREITRDNWYTFDFGRRRVWGDYLRIKTYGERGDIEFEEVRNLVEKIEKEIQENL